MVSLSLKYQVSLFNTRLLWSWAAHYFFGTKCDLSPGDPNAFSGHFIYLSERGTTFSVTYAIRCLTVKPRTVAT